MFADLHAVTRVAEEMFIGLAAKCIKERGKFTVALAGGSTPEPLYEALGSEKNQGRVDWEKVHLFWGDERHVPSDHPDSNYGMVRQALLEKVVIPEDNVHRVPAELDVHEAATVYEADLRAFFDGAWPRFDLVLLGMGEDGHTASLFPHSDGLKEEQRWFIANYAPKRETWRLTLTKNAINAARQIVVLVSGQLKAEMLAEVSKGLYEPESKPIQYISPTDGELHWLVDDEAGAKLK